MIYRHDYDCNLVYDPYYDRYVEPWNACATEDEALASGAALGMLAALEFLFALVTGLVLLIVHIGIKIIEWHDIHSEYKRLHEEREPLGYQVDAHLKERGDGLRARYLVTEWGVLAEEEYLRRRELQPPGRRFSGAGERGRWRLEGDRVVRDAV
ncbi:hypothetical protein [Desulfotruncus alcoholivorax]|uniref:hypothetical protein n=1 Tax=Desulfotruncus alcoholivorax TaxID=265477 RepID=UPI00040CE57E|nr:hypothetical protein [Desulfotruncus alcoholivorax]